MSNFAGIGSQMSYNYKRSFTGECAMTLDNVPELGLTEGLLVTFQQMARDRLKQLGLESLAAVFDLLPCGLSVATDCSCREIIHNQAAAKFFRVRPGENFSLSSKNPGGMVVYNKGKRLSLDELPIQRAVWFGQPSNSEEFECIWEDGVSKTALWSVEPLKNSAGEVFGAIATFEDLTAQKQAERERDGLLQRLQVHHQLLDGITNHAPIGLCTIDQDLRVTWSNMTFLQFLQKPEGLVLNGEPYAKLVPNADALGVLAAINRVLQTGKQEDLAELRPLRPKDQPIVYWTITITPFRTRKQPEQPQILLAMADVTASVLMKQELQRHHDQLAGMVDERTADLQEANKQLQLEVEHRQEIADQLQRSSQKTVDILESISDAFLALDADFNIAYVNHGAALHYGRSREELIGLHMAKLSPHFPQSEYKRQFTRALDEQQPVHFETFGNLSQRWMSVHVYPAADGLSVFFRDVSVRHQALAAMSRLASIVESTDTSIIYLNLDSIILAWNPGASRMFGYDATEAIGQSITLICPPDRVNEPQELTDKVAAGVRVVDYETVRRKKDGVLLNVSLHASPVKDSQGRIVGKSSIINDITERKRIEREFLRLDRLDLAAQLAASIGHEIRNPMTTVRGFLQLLGMKPKFADEMEFFQLMIDELDRANSIITEFLSLAKGKPVDRQLKSISEVVRHLTPLIQADAMLGGHQLELKLSDVPAILLEEKDIRQLLLNLIRNGLEAMPKGGRLTVSTFATSNQVRLEVGDQGCGIAPEHLDKVYVPFFTTKDTGTGLGLSVCYRIADQHGARIEIETNDYGTTFSVVFPLVNVS